MAIRRKTMVGFILVIATLVGGCIGAVHKVGDSKGWVKMGVDYAAWASTKTFRVGDSLVFEYNKEFHNVTEVALRDFESCTVPSSPLAGYGSGSDTVSLARTGHYYFVCAKPGHCQAGQKLHVLVVSSSSGPVTAPAPQPDVLSPTIF